MKKQIPLILVGIILIAGIFVFISNIEKQQDTKDVAIGNAVVKSNTDDKVSQESPVVTLKNGDTYNLTASYIKKTIAGKEQRMLAYNGSVPGPTISVTQGSEITVVFKNDTDSPQLLHSHGVRMDNQYDGSQMVQKEINPGDSFSYKLKFPDAGIYWYHPHAGEVVGQALGLYGAFVVTPTNKNYFSKVNDEQVLFLADIPMTNGLISINANSNALMGHYGNVMLTNGSENYTMNARKGEVKRLYVINSANVRPFNFTISGVKMKLVGGDSGAYEKASFVDSVLLAPSERAIVDVYFEKTGTYTMNNSTPNGRTILGKIVVADQNVEESYAKEFNTLETNQDIITSIDPFRSYFGKSPDKKIKLTIDMNGMGGGMMGRNMMQMGGSDVGIEWEDTGMMNNMMTTENTKWEIVDEETGKINKEIMWSFDLNKPVVIRIYNDKTSGHPMQHPIHFHGQRFLVVSRDGVRQTNLVWKDTALVKVGETVDIVLVPSNKGDWMAHCHISEHLASGMMFSFKVK